MVAPAGGQTGSHGGANGSSDGRRGSAGRTVTSDADTGASSRGVARRSVRVGGLDLYA